MDLRPDPGLRAFADEVRTWLEEHLVGDFARYRGRGLTGQEDVPVEVQLAWERELASGGWLGLDFPEWIGGRGCTLAEQVAFFTTYTRARAPGRLPNMGVTLLGPTLMAFGSLEQQRRFVPAVLAAEEMWCQGYSEPGAGSDLAGVSTRASKRGGQWVIHGQKVWTSLAQHADWAFMLARTDPGPARTDPGPARADPGPARADPGPARRHAGLSCLLVPMRQPGVEIRPITQLTGGVEFNETFLDGAVTGADMVVGGEGNGWRVAMGTLAFERGASTLGQQLSFRQELDTLVSEARSSGRIDCAALRSELAQCHIELEILRYNQMRLLTSLTHGAPAGPEQSIGKLYWASWHRRLGEIAMRVRGAPAMVADPSCGAHAGEGGLDYLLDRWQRTFLYSRAHTIYGGSNEIQRNIIAERVLDLPREPR